MDSLSGELWVVLAGLLLVAIRVGLTGRRRRWLALARRAEKLGWSARRRPSEPLPVRYGQLGLMRHGYNRRARHVIAKTGERSVRAFCLHYEAGFGKGHGPRDLTVAVAETDANRPGVWIGREGGLETVGAFARYRPVRVDADAGESPAGPVPSFDVLAESPQWVRAHVGADLLALLQTRDGPLTCEIRGPLVAVYRQGVAPAESQIGLLRRADVVAAALERTASGSTDGA